METKLDSRQAQGQFPATFPDTFKDFFAMMSEDEDHLDLFSNLLEDKVIPRANKFNQRRCGGSLRCPTHPNSAAGAGGSAAGHGGSGIDGSGSGIHNVGRSNSFRVNRPRSSFGSSSSSTTLNSAGLGGGRGGDVAGSGSLFCKHIKYCCLHQQQQQQQAPILQHKSNNQQLFQQQQPPPTKQQQQQLQQQQYSSHAHNYCPPNYHAASSCTAAAASASGTRLGPDGEDNSGCGASSTLLGDAGNNGYQQQQQLQLQQQQQHSQPHTSQQHQQQQLSSQKRHSIILERAFDFDASCDESDTISTTSSTPTAPPAAPARPATNIPYNILKPILKQPQQQSQQQLPPITPKEMPPGAAIAHHRMLPQPPKGVGMGAYHTKEAALHRIQQQSGLHAGSKTNLAALCGVLGSTANLAGIEGGSGVAAGGVAGTNGSNVCNANNNMSSSSSSNYYGSSSNYDIVGGARASGGGAYMDLHSPTAQLAAVNNKFNDLLNAAGVAGGGGCATVSAGLGAASAGGLGSTSRNNLSNIRSQKSPILNRRRSSSIVAANLLSADIAYNRGSAAGSAAGATTAAGDDNVGNMTHSSTRDRISLAKSPVSAKPPGRIPLIPVEGGVLTFQQAMSGAVSPQYSATSPLLHMGGISAGGGGGGSSGIVGGSTATTLDGLLLGGSSTALASVLEDGNSTRPANGGGPFLADSPTAGSPTSSYRDYGGVVCGGGSGGGCGVGASLQHGGSSATIAHLGNKQRQRMRTSSMPAESRKPRLADTRRAAIHCADIDLEYYRLRSFSITSHGVCNLGDSLRSRRSRSINSVTSTGTSNSGKDRHNSTASRTSGDIIFEQAAAAAGAADKHADPAKGQIPAYKIAMLGASGVGKSTLTYQFTTSEYICAYDLSLDDDYGQKTVSVLVDGIETDLEIIDHPACEMSTEAFCSTYNIDLFVVVYSVVDRASFKAAEKVLHYLKENEMLLTRGAILVGNKTDLERHREVNRQMARKVAKEVACKFIETSSGLDHNVDELLVGIVAQVKLNPQRLRNLSERDRQRLNLQSTIQKHRHMHMPQRRMVRQMSMFHAEDEDDDDAAAAAVYGGAVDAELERDENQSSNVMSSSNGNGDEGIGTGSERTASTSLSSVGVAAKATATATATTLSTSKGLIRKTNKRTLNLESILKMGESELEDEEQEAQRLQTQQWAQTRPVSKFELLTSGGAGGKHNGRTPFGSVNSSPKSRKSYESISGGSGGSGRNAGDSGNSGNRAVAAAAGNDAQLRDVQADDNLLENCNRKTVSKLTNRTKVFLSSVLRFKKAINVKRRNSSSCSDLFVI